MCLFAGANRRQRRLHFSCCRFIWKGSLRRWWRALQKQSNVNDISMPELNWVSTVTLGLGTAMAGSAESWRELRPQVGSSWAGYTHPWQRRPSCICAGEGQACEGTVLVLGGWCRRCDACGTVHVAACVTVVHTKHRHQGESLHHLCSGKWTFHRRQKGGAFVAVGFKCLPREDLVCVVWISPLNFLH